MVGMVALQADNEAAKATRIKRADEYIINSNMMYEKSIMHIICNIFHQYKPLLHKFKQREPIHPESNPYKYCRYLIRDAKVVYPPLLPPLCKPEPCANHSTGGKQHRAVRWTAAGHPARVKYAAAACGASNTPCLKLSTILTIPCRPS
ncbi:MAG: hypothetical protein KGL40_02055 [Rhodocyclaceae bacterium]|nr:hypothetical protein [Rhodocyclaceae bacterium]